MIFRLTDDLIFPRPELAEEDGLLAVGGDLSPERLILAYEKGIFPWFSEESPVLWYSPHERFVIFPSEVLVSSSMKKIIDRQEFSITVNAAFPEVIANCANLRRHSGEGTWITAEMEAAYIRLHELGRAHSVEAWAEGELVGGLYGVAVNRVFCGESMFSSRSNASKAALIWLCRHGGYRLIDCQVHTDHLQRMGARMISRQEYMRELSRNS